MACYCGNCASHQTWNYPPPSGASVSSSQPVKDLNKKEKDVTVKRRNEISIQGALTLKDLRELVDAANDAGLTDSARIKVTHYNGDQRDPSYDIITVSG